MKKHVQTFESYFSNFSILEKNVVTTLVDEFSMPRIFTEFVIQKIYQKETNFVIGNEKTENENLNKLCNWIVSYYSKKFVDLYNKTTMPAPIKTPSLSEKIRFALLVHYAEFDLDLVYKNKTIDVVTITKEKDTPKIVSTKLEEKLGRFFNNVINYYTKHKSEISIDYIVNSPFVKFYNDYITKDIVPTNMKFDRQDEKNNNAEIVITFPNGYYWVDLNTNQSDEEESFMVHCGDTRTRAYDGNNPEKTGTMFSLRNEHSQSLVTTTIDKDTKTFSQCKGKNNKKPDREYFPYIVELLKSEYVENIVPSLYEPHNNFSIKDLPINLQEEIKQTVNVQE